MPQTLSRALRTRLLNSDQLTRCLEDAHWVTGMDAAFLAPDGTVLSAFPRKASPNICTLIRSRLSSYPECAVCRLAHGGKGQYSVDRSDCPAHLSRLIHEFRVDDQTVGLFVLWPYRHSSILPESCREAWTRLAREGASISWNEWRHAWDKVIVLDGRRVEATRRWMGFAVKEAMDELDAEPRIRAADKALPGLVHRVCAIVRDRHSEPLRLSEIARSCGVTAEHMSRMFHQTTGLRFRDYLREVRLNEACRLLMDEPIRITEVAERVGHSSLSRFNKAFKEYMGMTPGEWRRRSKRKGLDLSRGSG